MQPYKGSLRSGCPSRQSSYTDRTTFLLVLRCQDKPLWSTLLACHNHQELPAPSATLGK